MRKCVPEQWFSDSDLVSLGRQVEAWGWGWEGCHYLGFCKALASRPRGSQDLASLVRDEPPWFFLSLSSSHDLDKRG